jgi:hypothetical protein
MMFVNTTNIETKNGSSQPLVNQIRIYIYLDISQYIVIP